MMQCRVWILMIIGLMSIQPSWEVHLSRLSLIRVARSMDRDFRTRVKRQVITDPQPFPVLNAVVNVPIPTNIGHFPGVSKPVDKCDRDEILMEDGTCQNLLTDGNCGPNEEILLDPDTNMGFCAPRLCPPDRVFVHATQLCHDPQEMGICPPGRELYYSAYGSSVCSCPDGTVEGDDDLDDDVCELVLGESLLCLAGQVFWFKDFNSPPECLPDPCKGVNLNKKPNELPFVPSKATGECFQLGQSEGVCPSGLFYTLALEELKGQCESLEDAGFNIFTPEELEAIKKIYGPTISENNAPPIPTDMNDTISSSAISQTTGGTGRPVSATANLGTDHTVSGTDLNSQQGSTAGPINSVQIVDNTASPSTISVAETTVATGDIDQTQPGQNGVVNQNQLVGVDSQAEKGVHGQQTSNIVPVTPMDGAAGNLNQIFVQQNPNELGSASVSSINHSSSHNSVNNLSSSQANINVINESPNALSQAQNIQHPIIDQSTPHNQNTQAIQSNKIIENQGGKPSQISNINQQVTNSQNNQNNLGSNNEIIANNNQLNPNEIVAGNSQTHVPNTNNQQVSGQHKPSVSGHQQPITSQNNQHISGQPSQTGHVGQTNNQQSLEIIGAQGISSGILGQVSNPQVNSPEVIGGPGQQNSPEVIGGVGQQNSREVFGQNSSQASQQSHEIFGQGMPQFGFRFGRSLDLSLPSSVPRIMDTHVSILPSGDYITHSQGNFRPIRSAKSDIPEEFNLDTTSNIWFNQALIGYQSILSRRKRYIYSYATPSNVFESRLLSCKPGAARDINAKCRNKVLPAKVPKSRSTRAAPPIPPTPSCSRGQAFNLRRQCVPTTTAQQSLMAYNLG